MFNYLYRYSTVFSYFQLAFLDVIVKIGIGDLSTDSKALYIIIIMFKEILIGYIANQWNPFPCCVLVQAAMDWPVIFKWTLFSYRNPVYLNLWLWSFYITCVFCLYLLLFIFLLIQLLFFTLYMHVNVKHVNTYIYIYIPKFNFNLTVNMDLVVIFFCSDSLPLTILSSLLTIFWNVINRQESLPLNSLLRRY